MKNTCAVISGSRVPSLLSTSNNPVYNTTLFSMTGVGRICRSLPNQRRLPPLRVVK